MPRRVVIKVSHNHTEKLPIMVFNVSPGSDIRIVQHAFEYCKKRKPYILNIVIVDPRQSFDSSDDAERGMSVKKAEKYFISEELTHNESLDVRARVHTDDYMPLIEFRIMCEKSQGCLINWPRTWCDSKNLVLNMKAAMELTSTETNTTTLSVTLNQCIRCVLLFDKYDGVKTSCSYRDIIPPMMLPSTDTCTKHVCKQYVYVATSPDYRNKYLYKIGTTRNPLSRIEAINRCRAYDLMYYDVLCELGTCDVESATIVERTIRERFVSYHTKHGDFYNFCDKETYQVVRECIVFAATKSRETDNDTADDDERFVKSLDIAISQSR